MFQKKTIKTHGFKKQVILPGLFLLCFMIPAQRAFSQLSISPSRLNFQGKPGETVSQILNVVNNGSKALELNVSFRDWSRDSVGMKVYAEPGKLPHSNAKQVRITESLLVLKAGESKKIPVYFDIPANSSDSLATNSMLFFTQNLDEPEKTNNPSVAIKVGYEYGVQVFYNPYGANEGALDFEQFDYLDKKTPADLSQLRIKYKNKGNLNKIGTMRLELTNKKTGEEFKLPDEDLAIMPLSSQVVYVSLAKKITPGEYLVVAILDEELSHTHLKVAEKNIYVK